VSQARKIPRTPRRNRVKRATPIKANVLANYASQLYISLIGLVMLPIYLRLMGGEAFGLISFFAMLQVWFGLLDFGLSATLSRETARHFAGATEATTFRTLIRTLEMIFLLIASIGACSLLLVSGYLSTQWLKAAKLDVETLEFSIQIMSVIVALRWMSSLHRSVIQGAERFVWLAGYNSIAATARFVIVVPVMLVLGPSPAHFFSFQLLIALIEFVGFWYYASRLLPKLAPNQQVSFELNAIKPILKFSLTMAFSTVIWIIMTQTDKLILSKVLSLEEYGYFSLAVLLASSILLISGPISMTIMPRLASLQAEGRHHELIALYRSATQWVAVIVSSGAVTIALCSSSILLVWTGNPDLSHKASGTLALYTLGNSVLAMAAFPYYLQYARGDLRLQLVGSVVFVALLVPISVYATIHFGAEGAGYAWLGLNLVSLFAWTPIVHKKLANGLGMKWLWHDVLMIYAPVILCGFVLQSFIGVHGGRLDQMFLVLVLGLILFFVAVCSASTVRKTCMRAIGL
jgi:O-antigen/teichoic acid export membrane protein